ncbi:MAG: hypothetical protein N2572_01095 [Syntrophales bacterium]|nr:hypothetical protein [Syntrophales bacterium]
MRRKRVYQITLVVFLCAAVIIGCGGIRYSQLDPAAKDFKPKRLAVLPLEVGPYEEARETIDMIIAGILAERKWFEDIVAGESMKVMLKSNEEFRRTAVDYTTKLKMVNFSDPALSHRLGEIARVDAILLGSVDYWLYSKEGNKKIAKVGLSLRLVEAKTGKIMWKGSHHIDESYSLFAPKLESVATSLAKKMLDEMPH